MAKNDNDRYAIPNKERGSWDVMEEDRKRASGHFGTQGEAVTRAKRIVEDSVHGEGEVRIQGKHGKFRDSDSGSRNESNARDTRH